MTTISESAALIAHAQRCLGIVHYHLGAGHDDAALSKPNPPTQMDCSGFILWCHEQIGLREPGQILHGFCGGTDNILAKWKTLNRVLTVDQARNRGRGTLLLMEGRKVAKPHNHIGILIAHDWLIHCTSSKDEVRIEDLRIYKLPWTCGGYFI